MRRRSYNEPTLEDKFDKTQMPKPMQVRPMHSSACFAFCFDSVDSQRPSTKNSIHVAYGTHMCGNTGLPLWVSGRCMMRNMVRDPPESWSAAAIGSPKVRQFSVAPVVSPSRS